MLGFEGNKTPGKVIFLHVLYDKYFKCLGSKITNDAGCTRAIKSRITMAKQHSKWRRIFSPEYWTEI